MPAGTPGPVWVHHPPSGRTQQVSQSTWDTGDLAGDGWELATDDQVAASGKAKPATPEPEPEPEPTSGRRRR